MLTGLFEANVLDKKHFNHAKVIYENNSWIPDAAEYTLDTSKKSNQ